MNFLQYKQGKLSVHGIAIDELVKTYGSPLYIYSQSEIQAQWQSYDESLKAHKHLVCYAIKANSNLAVLSTLAKLGSGFDIVSQGELERVLKVGADPKKIVFSGVAKSETEITRALQVGIKCFNVESEAELDRIQRIASSLDIIAPISLRINPDVDAKTHPYISTGLRENKFGISYQYAQEIYQKAHSFSHIKIEGIDCHIGSQLTELSPFLDAIDRILALVESLKSKGIELHHIDLGGGLGVCYRDETPLTPSEFVEGILTKLAGYENYEILLEPGRSIVANAGALVVNVEYVKHQEENHFAIVNSGMNHLIRPALYQSWMRILPVNEPAENEPSFSYNVVGPICESSDVFGRERELSVKQDDLLVICDAGAYGFSMASNYNSYPKPAELMVDSNQTHRLIRKRETFEDLWKGESI